MFIVVGTTSSKKLSILRKAIDGQLAVYGVEGVEVGSQEPELATSIEEIEQRAIDRAKHAFASQAHVNLGVGLEVGLEDRHSIFWLVGVAAFWDGENIYVGHGQQLPLPIAVSKGVKQGGSFDQLIQSYQQTATPDEAYRIEQLITWEEPLTSAIQPAIKQLKRDKGIGGTYDLAALFTSEQSSALLLKLSAVCMGLFFGLRAMIAFGSPLLGLMQQLQPWFAFGAFYQALYLLVVLGYVCLLLGLWRLTTKLSSQQHPSLVRQGWLALLTAMPYMVVWMLLIGVTVLGHAYQWLWIVMHVWGDLLLLLSILSLIGMSMAFWLLLRQFQHITHTSVTTTLYIMVGLLTSMGVNELMLRQNDGPHPFIMPIYLLGLGWSVGWWQLSRDIVAFDREV